MMDDMIEYIKLDRNFIEWRWFQDANTLKVFLYLLFYANYNDAFFENIVVHRGELVAEYETIANKTWLSVRNVRTAIRHLKSTGEITQKLYGKYQVITVTDYEHFVD